MDEIVKKRLFDNIFVCGKCKSKIRANPFKVRDRKIKCRKCGSVELRPKSKEARN